MKAPHTTSALRDCIVAHRTAIKELRALRLGKNRDIIVGQRIKAHREQIEFCKGLKK